LFIGLASCFSLMLAFSLILVVELFIMIVKPGLHFYLTSSFYFLAEYKATRRNI
jgi:hypothetical protein